ncbi:Small auxin-up RNA protein [Dioscorea alata]|uniref:Small auxin-up RNA protein n=1 Tax=Dioscorea alata TaxID=55571 RepID=A0ACB7WT15_DIOAL|nr:Small auxin-up RNA protein [Dioscorea alata]
MVKAKSVKKLKDAMQALQKSLSFSRGRSGAQPDECMSEDEIVVVPEDVKEGHFAVLAVHGERPPKRYVLSLRCLSHPVFLQLLEMASEEFGFSQAGAIAVPCRPCELERIISDL